MVPESGNGSAESGNGSASEAWERKKMESGSESGSVEPREEWDRKIEFILACVGYAVGLGNIWRFPFLCYESGGGAFLIPYVIMLFVCGIPLFYMELAVGQFTRLGPFGAIGSLCPLLKGAGLAAVLLSFFLTTYYNVIIAWAIYYIGYSFSWNLPWKDCSFAGHSENCWDSTTSNFTASNNSNSVSPSEDFYNQIILQVSDGIEETGRLRGPMVGVLLLAWVMVYFALFKGVKLTGKIVYFTALFPYFVLTAFLIRGLSLPGASKGIEFYIKPNWTKLASANVWVNAAIQNFNSIGIAFGSLISLASYNPRQNDFLKDTLVVGLINSATSIFSGFAIFSVLGYVAHIQGKHVADVVTPGPGLVFVAYPAAISEMDGAPIWSLLFFVMIICLGLDSQFCMVEVVVTTLFDMEKVRKFFKRKEVVVLAVCSVSFLLGLPFVTEAGIYYFHLVDRYSSGISLMFVAFFEVLAICWIYGANRLSENIRSMVGKLPLPYFTICWYAVSPVMIAGLCLFGWINYQPLTYGRIEYPLWAHGLGWMIAGLSLACIPIFAVIAVYGAKGANLSEKIRNSVKSRIEESEVTNRADQRIFFAKAPAELVHLRLDAEENKT